jgi:TP901 family phage tail tape measure protein
MASNLNVAVVVGLVNRLSAPLRRLQQDVGQFTAKMAMAGAGAGAFGAGILLPLRQAVGAATELSSSLTDVGIVADVSAARIAAMRPELRRLAETSNQFVPALAQGLKDLTGKGMALDAAMAALPAIAKTTTAAGAEMADMSAAASALIDNLGIVPAELQRTLDILTVAGNAGAFELKNMAQEFPVLSGKLKALGMQGEAAAASIGAALQVAMKMAGSPAEAANNVANFLGHLTRPGTVDKIKKEWGVNFPAAFKRWQEQGLNPVEESLKLIQQYTNGDQFKISAVFEDVQTVNAILPLLQNYEKYLDIRDRAMAGSGAAQAQFDRRTTEDPAQRFKALSIQVGNLTDRLGQALTPVLLKVVAAVRPLIDRLAAWIDANPELASGIAIGVAALGALSATAGVALLALGPLVFVLTRLTGATVLLGRVLLMTPIGRVISLIGGAVYALAHWQETIGALGRAWDWLLDKMGSGGRAAWQHVWQVVDDLFFGPFKAMFKWLDEVLGGWPSRAYAYGAKVIESLVAGLKSMWHKLIDWLRSLDLMPDWVKSLFGIGTPPAAVTPPTTAPIQTPITTTPGPPTAAPAARLPTVTIGPERTAAEAVAMAQRYGQSPAVQAASRMAPTVHAAASPTSRTAWAMLSGLLAPAMGAMPTATAAASAPRAPGPAITIPISITIQAPPGADPQRLAELVRREVQGAASQAGQRLAALYDGSDL